MPLAPMIVEEALRRAAAGDTIGGGTLLAPLVEDSRRECFALCVMLATTATYGMRPQGPDQLVALQVENTKTRRPASPEELPPPVLFAARFAAAHANRDPGGARALFEALAVDAESEAGQGRIQDGVLALYAMAVARMRQLTEAEPTPPEES
ncbi:hypothetical protein ABTX34_16920 [Streptomyces sp. NPDC096538]|uniref:hypothetical protein n=1 Tax=Streptomyces sp. NPDC096538 TaxID=3155427 RepID=UPI003319CA04